MFFVSSFFVCYWQVSPTHNRPAGSGEQKQSYTVLSSPPRVAFGLRYGTISSCWHTTASQPGGHSVNKMSVARETEKSPPPALIAVVRQVLARTLQSKRSEPIFLFTTIKGKVQLHCLALHFSLKGWTVLHVYHHSVRMVFGFKWIIKNPVLQ